ncbi:hypothetical protein DSH85_09045 [Enterococcus faecium]|nr:hypothetical protein [Enterococcus faecium]EGP5717993.1 hypothetical protein [Enterococcus faecium]
MCLFSDQDRKKLNNYLLSIIKLIYFVQLLVLLIKQLSICTKNIGRNRVSFLDTSNSFFIE